MISFEVCDLVQENLYKIDGFKMSDFVTPEWSGSKYVQNSHA